MAISFTPQQKKVIDARNCNVLVSAAAGSGKTAVLVERIIQMICDEKDPVDVDRLLVVTFTNAAAAQMRERIGKALEEKLSIDPGNEHLQRQITLLHNAQIMTVHSFCLFVIRNHFHTIGLDPSFRVADEGETKLLQQDVLKTLMEARFADRDEKFRECVEYFCLNGKESILEQHILDLYTFAMSYPWPEEWLEERKKDYDCVTTAEFDASPIGRYWLELLQSRSRDLLELLKMASEICELPDGPYMYGETISAEMEKLEKLGTLSTPEKFQQMLETVTFPSLPRKADDSVDPGKREMAKDLRNRVKEGVRELSEQYFFIPYDMAVSQQKVCGEMLSVLIDLTLQFKELFDRGKREKRILDFNDIEHFALDILCRTPDGPGCTEAAKEYRSYFREVLIDEYQDSNLVQEFLLKAVSGEDDGIYNRFMVGDVKQSIYRFRLAKPALFMEKYDTYEREKGEKRRIDLSQNFRSRGTVLDTVNSVFEKIMIREVGGIVYDADAALYRGASYPENDSCESELIFVEKPEKGDGLSAKEAEALAVAQRILDLRKDFKVTDPETGALRSVKYSDIVILLRSTSGWDEEFRRVLQKEGIPAYVAAKTGYFAVPEIQNILSLLKVLDNPLQDIPFYGVMTSVFGGFTEEEIAEMRSGDREETLYHCVEEQAEHREKCRMFLERIKKYRKESVYLPVSRLLREILKDSDYLSYVSALPGGEQRRANVEMFLEKAVAFESSSFYGLFHFIRYMEQLDQYDVDCGEANILDENADVVRIMSIHKSKGLEFPVTFVCGLGKRFNMQDSTRTLLLDDGYGLGMSYVNLKERVKCKTLRRNILSAKLQSDNLAEELRVLYVAMTRAKEKLIMTGVLQDSRVKYEKAVFLENVREKKELSSFEILHASSYWNYILPSAEKFEKKFLTCEELLHNRIQENVEEGVRKERLQQAGLYADPVIVQKLEEKFRYQYPHTALEKLYTKTTVSELKMAAMADKEEAVYDLFAERETPSCIPKFRQTEEKVSGSTRGTAVHKVMELMDFIHYRPEREWIENCLKEKVKEGRLSEQYYGMVRVEKIQKFLESPLAGRMKQAAEKGQLYREQPFVYGIRANRLSAEFPPEETVLIQGIIDAFFEEDGELVLLDYKTDRVSVLSELVSRYETQMDYYREALEKLTGKHVKERILYSFSLGEEITV